MTRIKPTGSSKTAQRVVPLLVGVAVAATSAVLLPGGPASAEAHTVTVSFTADGPSPASVTIRPGDQVTYRNDVDPNAGSLLGTVTSAVRSVTVEVANASRTPFSLEPGRSATLTYSEPVRTTYTATYQPTMVLGLLPGGEMTTTGTLLVQDTSGAAVPVVTPGTPATGGAGSARTGQLAGPDQPVAPGTSAAQGGPRVNYTPGAGNAAAGQVPPAGSVARPTTGSSGGVTELPQLGSAQSRTRSLGQASSDNTVGSLGLPAITAVVLLSMVSAGLVRTIMVRHASLA